MFELYYLVELDGLDKGYDVAKEACGNDMAGFYFALDSKDCFSKSEKVLESR